jgi:cytochrome c peroxidase
MGLRNIESSAPYMHNGALETLEAVVAFYNRGGGEDPNKSPLLKPLGLSEEEQADLVAFLRALTGVQREMTIE